MKLMGKIVNKRLDEEQEKTKRNRIFDENMKATVGASDLACPRKACMSIMYPEKFTPEKLILLNKGNVAESIFMDSLDYVGIKCETQRSYFGEKNTIFSHMKVHPDLVVYLDTVPISGNKEIDDEVDSLIRAGKKIWLTEVKTSGVVPEESHFYWTLQVIMQAGLIALEHDLRPDQIDINLIVVNLNTGKSKEFHYDWNEDLYYEGLEISLAIQSFKEELIEIMSGVRQDFTVTAEEMPAIYNAGICSMCEYSDTCPLFGKGGTFEIGDELQEGLLYYLDSRDKFYAVKDKFEEDLKPIFEKIGKSGKGKKVEGKFTPGKEIDVLLSSDIPKEVIAEIAAKYPDSVCIDTGRLKALDETAFVHLSRKYGTKKMTKQRLVIKKKKH